MFLDGPSPHTYCGWEFLATCLVRSNIIDQYKCLLTNSAQEITPYRCEFKCDTNRIRKYFLSVLWFEHRSLGWMTDAIANSALLTNEYFIKKRPFWKKNSQIAHTKYSYSR
jgi:hypothetical protein